MRTDEIPPLANPARPPLNHPWRMPVRDIQSTPRKVKKIPPELRRKRFDLSKEPSFLRRILGRIREDSQFVRTLVQAAFVLLCIWIGIEFAVFLQWGQSGGKTVFVERPPGVEGFLPISALMSLKYWLQTGIINDIHPAGLMILLAIILVAVLLKKAFCGWLCPIGTISESLWMFGQRMFRRNLTPQRWLDCVLRSLKYFLLLFFGLSILGMDVQGLHAFIYSPYNKVADVKMYQFFADITSVALWTIIVLVIGSVAIKGFWCRYLCPYGALLGVLSWLSPLKITRNAATCIDCALCTRACPAGISVHTATRVWSDECMSCYRCVEACPVKNTLGMRLTRRSRPVPAWVFAVLVAGVFAGVTGLAMLTGHWHNSISRQEYLRRIQTIDAPIYQHFRGQVPVYGPNDETPPVR